MSVIISSIQKFIKSTAAATITDNFQSYSVGVLAGQGNWLSLKNNIRVYDNAGAKTIGSTDDDTINMAYLSGTFPANQKAQVKVVSTVGSNSFHGVMVRVNGTDGYFLYASTYRTKLYSYIADSYVEIGLSNTGVGVVADDIISLEIIGTTLYPRINGNTIAGIGDVVDANISSGNPGVITDNTTGAGIPLMDDFECTATV